MTQDKAGDFWMVIAMTLLMVGLGLLACAAALKLAEWRLDKEGVVTYATLERVLFSTSRKYRGQKLLIRFTTQSGKTVSAYIDRHRQIPEAGGVRVRYLPTRPETFRVIGRDAEIWVDGNFMIYLLVGGLLTATGVSVLRQAWKERRKQAASGAME